MIQFIPLEYYTPVFYQFILLMIAFVFLSSYKYSLEDSINLSGKNILGVFVLIFIIFYMGLRPVSGKYFGDMSTYAKIFRSYTSGNQYIEYNKDFGFSFFLNFCTKYLNLDIFFLLCSFLYIFPLYLSSKKIFKEYWFYSFFILACSFSFWAAGVNGIRAGIASSFLIIGLSREKKLSSVIWFFLAVSFHKSMVIPVLAFLIASIYRNSKFYLIIWLLAIPLSYAIGNFFENLFISTGLLEEEVSVYFSDEIDKGIKNSEVGFRWDFILYSCIPVFTGWYFIFKKNYVDKLYITFFNCYLIANTFWILVIRANFSNRFAYLSWFIMGIIVVFPFLKISWFKKQHVILAWVFLFYYLFTYTLNFLLAK